MDAFYYTIDDYLNIETQFHDSEKEKIELNQAAPWQHVQFIIWGEH